MQIGPTSMERLTTAREIGCAAGLSFVYLSNRLATGGQDTVCPNCDTGNRERHRLASDQPTAAQEVD